MIAISCLFLESSVTNLWQISFHPLPPLRGTPLVCYSEWDTIPRKKPGNQILQEDGDFVWRVSDCEELAGVTYYSWHTNSERLLLFPPEPSVY